MIFRLHTEDNNKHTAKAEQQAKMSSTNDFATTYIKDKQYYLDNIKDKSGYRDVSRHIDTRKTKKSLSIKGAGKLKVFIATTDQEDFDERANPSIVYKYDVAALPSHPLGKDGEWGFMATCPQGTVWVILPTTCTTMTTTTTTTKKPYEFIPEIWNLIKEYAVPKKYEYDEEDCLYDVEIYRFLETIEEGYDKEHYATTKMVVETDGEDAEITFFNAITGEYIEKLETFYNHNVTYGCCKPRFSNWCRAEFMLSELMPEGYEEWLPMPERGIDWHYTDLKLSIELAERGNAKYLIDREDPENPVHCYD